LTREEFGESRKGMPETPEIRIETTPTAFAAAPDPVAELRQKVRWAAEVATEAGDYRELAFAKVLDYLFSQTVTGTSTLPSYNAEATELPSRTFRQNGSGPRRSVKSDPSQLERIRSLLEAPPEAFGQLVAAVSKLQSKYQIYAVLEFASDRFGLPALSLAEIREILKQKLRLGMADGTLRGVLSKAPATEIGRTKVGERETDYQLMQSGIEAVRAAREGDKKLK
jgi:hypothetical protein